MATVFERIRAIVVKQLDADPKEVTTQTSFTEDLGADSLDLVELIMALEEEFAEDTANELNITDEQAEKILTIQDTIDLLKELGVSE